MIGLVPEMPEPNPAHSNVGMALDMLAWPTQLMNTPIWHHWGGSCSRVERWNSQPMSGLGWIRALQTKADPGNASSGCDPAQEHPEMQTMSLNRHAPTGRMLHRIIYFKVKKMPWNLQNFPPFNQTAIRHKSFRGWIAEFGRCTHCSSIHKEDFCLVLYLDWNIIWSISYIACLRSIYEL